MRHRHAHRKLGRHSGHRKALLRNLATTLIRYGHLRTTLARAREVRPFTERLVTLGRRADLAARRQALRVLPQKQVVNHLFAEVAPKFEERAGGYTRILKLGPRVGDGAPMARIEFLEYGEPLPPGPAASGGKRRKKK